MKKIIESYSIKSEGFTVSVNIISESGLTKKYELIVPEIKDPTRALLDEVKHDLITEIKISTSEILDIKIIENLKERFNNKAGEIIKNKLPDIKDQTLKLLVSILLNEMLGLENLEFLLNDENLEEIVIVSSKEPIRVYHKKHGWLETNITIKNEDQIQNYGNIIARRIGRQVTTLNPLLDAHLITGDRANVVLYPVATKGNTITIRKFARDPWTVVDFMENNTCTSNIFALLWLAVQYEMNVLVSGGTASGKTSFLNILMPFIPTNHRVLSIEDTRELQLPEFLYWTPLITRQPNPEGLGEVSMIDLLVNSLRMRPDRIILGEIRRAREAEVLFEAMHTGHSVYSTVHADSMSETIQRLINPPINVPSNLLNAVNLNVVMFRDRKKGIRRVYQIGEFLSSEEEGKPSTKPNILYRWNPGKDKIVEHASSLRFFDELSRHTGMTIQEINQEIKDKKSMLDYLLKNNLRSINYVGRFMKEYYLNPDLIQNIVKKNKKPKEIFA